MLMVPYHHASSINLINMFLLGQTKLSGGTYYENFLLELNHIYFNSLSYVKFYATITLFLKSDCNREKNNKRTLEYSTENILSLRRHDSSLSYS